MPDDDELNLDPSALPSAPAPAPAAAPPVPAPTPAVAAPTLPSPAPAAPARPAKDPALEARITDQADRRVKKQLRTLFGTDDEEEIQRLVASHTETQSKLAQLQAEEDRRKRESMSETEQLRQDLQAVTAERDQLKAQLEDFKKNDLANKQNQKLTEFASAFIRPNRIRHALSDFREYVLGLKAEDRKRVNEQITKNWFKKYSIDNPDFALPPEKPATSANAETVEKPVEAPKPAAPAAPTGLRPLRPIGAPKPAPKPNTGLPPADPFAGFDPRPGRPNSMSKEMLKDYAKAQGIKSWP